MNPATASLGVWRPNSWTHASPWVGCTRTCQAMWRFQAVGSSGEPADVDVAIRAGGVDVGLRGVDDCPAEGVKQIEHRSRAVVAGEPVAVFHGGTGGGGEEGGGDVHGWTIPSLTCCFTGTRTLAWGVPERVVLW